MTVNDLFNSHLLVGKSVTLSFPSKSDAERYKKYLISYRHKLKNQLDSLGLLEDVMPNNISKVRMDYLPAPIKDNKNNNVLVSIYLGLPSKQSIQFTIIDPIENK